MTLQKYTQLLRYLWVWIALVTLLLTGASCTRESQRNRDSTFRIELEEPLFPPGVGPDTLTIRVFGAENRPVSDARLTVKGDMTHAGMVPVLAEVDGGIDGVYSVPITWTMAGDWVVTVEAQLPDGASTWASFDLKIDGEAANCETGEEGNTANEQ